MAYIPSLIYFDRDDYIRILKLSPGEFDDPIVCDLKIASVDHLPQHFEALSYCWGNQKDRGPITLHGTESNATTSLITALRYLRYTDRPRILWVDALCINQADTEELNNQIIHMESIYSRAARVLAWVGTDEWEPKAAFDAIRRRAEQSASPDEASLEAIFRFFSSPYWDRLWIVQEVAHVRDISIICGREQLPWTAIQQLMAPDAAGRRLPDGLPYHMRRGLWKVRHLWHTRTILNSADERLKFLQVLNKFNRCLCFLPKDSVYATLAMSSSAVRRVIRPDYTDRTSLEEVFCQATAACIVEQGNLDVLSLTRRWTQFGEYQVSGDAPKPPAVRTSWAGEWSTVRIIRPLLEPDDAVQVYAAAPSHGFDVENAKNGVLKLKGVILDVLRHVEELSNPYQDGWEDRTRAWEPQHLDTYEHPTVLQGAEGILRVKALSSSFSVSSTGTAAYGNAPGGAATAPTWATPAGYPVWTWASTP
ncbi:Heterokaryon incompatibility protein 6, OR allele 6 [Colletotrichum sojae]|uniref:Heterokaryon incompatibility protein 6, OR allele 6 n=1 Tax=Colletotrichum sojae TaxID=2175907 RepID=A0A8H6IQL5_9PEZI|nr:Heterokaryon incompatibility protein 6, OR allele 6 [Colletotrichum sojae]